MRAMRFRSYGTPDALELVSDAPMPDPSKTQVLVRVHATSVNPIDWQLASGQYRWLVPTRMPAVPGFDVSGEVARVGAKVTEVGVGDRVCGLTSTFGGCAEYAVVDRRALARVPANMNEVQAAALPLAGVTALQCLRDHGGLNMHGSKQRVLIVGASGGVGHYAVQIAHAAGAHVVGVCSGPNEDLVRGLGADDVIDYRTQTDFGAGYDIVVDAVGHGGFAAFRGCLSKCGRYVAPNPSAGDILWTILTRASGSRKCNAMLFRSRGRDLELLAQMVGRNELRSVVDQTFSFDELARAHRLSMAGRVRGKLVVVLTAKG